jgi:hypothetical protein
MSAGSTSLQELIAESGHIAGPRIADFTHLATAVQLKRRELPVSSTDLVTRTTALWTLMELDQGINQVLQNSGLDQRALQGVLSLAKVPPPIDADVVQLHEDFAHAMQTYLSDLSDRHPIDLPDLAAAVLHAGRDDSRGLLPGRLRDLKLDLDTAISAIDALVIPTPARPTLFDDDDFSSSVLQVRRRLGGATSVTAAQIAEGLQADHPRYGEGRFEHVKLRPSAGNTATTNEWLGRVRSLYDVAQVAASRHRVIDGELTLAGLAELDASLAQDLRPDGFLDALSSGIEPALRRATRDRTEWVPDAPAATDLLGRERLAEALAERVKRLTEPRDLPNRSFLVHVDGPWGAGKSTLFEFLERKLEPEFLVVNINAWREQRVGVQWWTLLSALRRAVVWSRPWYRRPLAWFEGLADRIRAGWVPFLAALLVLGAAVVGLVSVADLNLARGGKAADSILKVISLGAAAFAGVVAATRFLLPGSRKSAQGFVETSNNPMAEVGRLFARALGRAKRPVVFLIDDLDRCDENYVVEFLEVMQTIVRDAPRFQPKRAPSSGPYAFIAADGRWIRSSYEKRYDAFQETAVPGRPLGYLFLEKIFQLHVQLPSITRSAKEAYFLSLLVPEDRRRAGGGGGGAENDAVRTTKAAVDDAQSEGDLLRAGRKATQIEDPVARMEVLGDVAVKFSQREIIDATEHALNRFGAFLEPNPRSMKLFVNTYGVLRSLRTFEEVFVASGPLALWTVVEIRWPYLADYLRANPEAVEGKETDENVPDSVRLLLVDDDVALVLGDKQSGPLTPDLIRECAGAA